jgi:hypothetical protein
MNGEGENRIGMYANFILKRSDGRMEVYTGKLIGISETHLTIRLNDGRETSLLRTDVQKIEWVKA